MKPILVVLVALLFPAMATGQPSLSGHWQDANGVRFFLYHKDNGNASVWMVVAGRQVGFETGSLTLLSPKDNIAGSLYEINVRSDETVSVRVKGMACEIRNLSFSLLGTLNQRGWRGRNMGFGAVGFVTGTMVCGSSTSPWSMPYLGSWKRL
jgi:hypothetical protein